ncbi:MAG: cation diffusion facilitator family transporter [Bacteroidales bacterium]|nr:cation diffusion facilitator family transporter [Bacteroidales bacterium]MDD4672271.1 cation diffusion facilitator family transporter [Bacteroidales bacterium]
MHIINKANTNLSKRAGWMSIVVNTLLFILKYWAGIVSGSVALMADAWHTLSDSLSSIFLIVGISLSQKPADKEHPFGHGRNELITSILIGCLLAMVAYNFFVESIERLTSHKEASYGIIAIVITVISILAKEGLAQYSFYIGRKTNSQAVKADGWHHRSDSLSSIAILLGIWLSRFFWWIDGAMGIIVSLFILYTAYKIIRSASHTILGNKPSKQLINDVSRIANKAANFDVYSHHIHIHDYVNHKELTLHIYLPDDMSISESHKITSAIEKGLAQELDVETTIHCEPIKIMLKE